MVDLKTGQLSASLEDYLETILYLAEADSVARSRDIAEHLSVSRASVTGALRVLSEKGLIYYRPYEHIRLTDKGYHEARKVTRRHYVLQMFFTDVLGLDDRLARESACRAEHALGQQVVGRLMRYIEFVTNHQTDGKDHIAAFQGYCRSFQSPSEMNLCRETPKHKRTKKCR